VLSREAGGVGTWPVSTGECSGVLRLALTLPDTAYCEDFRRSSTVGSGITGMSLFLSQCAPELGVCPFRSSC
jgi:hypothetical protein